MLNDKQLMLKKLSIDEIAGGIHENLRANKKRLGNLFLYSNQNFLVDQIRVNNTKKRDQFHFEFAINKHT